MGIDGHRVPERLCGDFVTWAIESGSHIGFWVASHLGTRYWAEGSTALGLVRDGVPVAGVIYENWNGKSVVVHLVAKDRLTPRFIAAICDYPFNVCGAVKAIAPVEISNLKSAKLVEKMGFVSEATLRNCHPNGDIVLYTLTKSDCRFLEGRYGKKLTDAPRHT